MASQFILVISILLLLFTSGSDAANELVDNVCKKASNYTFCVESLNLDPRTPDADQYTLAYISVGLAYGKATTTRDHISELLKNTDPGNLNYRHALQTCAKNYDKAVPFLVTAHNDLDSESFSDVPVMATKTSRETNQCEAAFKGVIPSSPLTNMNNDLIGLCEIYAIVAKLFTGEL